MSTEKFRDQIIMLSTQLLMVGVGCQLLTFDFHTFCIHDDNNMFMWRLLPIYLTPSQMLIEYFITLD